MDCKGSRSDHSQATGPPQAVWPPQGRWQGVLGDGTSRGQRLFWVWGRQPGRSQAGDREVGDDARTSDLQVPTGSLHRVRGWGATLPGWAGSAKWAELSGLQSWGAPGYGGDMAGVRTPRCGRAWVSGGSPAWLRKWPHVQSPVQWAPSALMTVRGPPCSSLAPGSPGALRAHKPSFPSPAFHILLSR